MQRLARRTHLAAPRNREISSLIGRSKLGTSRIGIAVIDVRSGETLAELRGDDPFIPASNMKLLTSGAALRTLGSDFEFRTELARTATGKLQKFKLREPFWEGHTRQVN